MVPQTSMEFLGALLCVDQEGAARHRSAMVWTKYWAINGQLRSRSLGVRTRIKKFRSEILPVLTRVRGLAGERVEYLHRDRESCSHDSNYGAWCAAGR